MATNTQAVQLVERCDKTRDMFAPTNENELSIISESEFFWAQVAAMHAKHKAFEDSLDWRSKQMLRSMGLMS
ncbi:MAG: hypothetical protein WCL34_14165 [Methylococcaceae bacterium]